MIHLYPYLWHLAVLIAALVVWALAGRRLAPVATAWVLAGLVAATLGWHLTQVSEPRHLLFADFYKAYLPAGVAVANGNVTAFEKLILDRDFVNLPVVAVLFAPLAWVSAPMAGWLFMALGIVCVVAFTALIVRRTGMAGAPLPAFLALVAVFGPLWYSFGEGNTTHMVLLLLLAAMLACERRRTFTAGVLLGIAAVIKLPLLLFGVYYALRGRWRVVAGGATVLVLAGAVSLLMFGWPLHQLWHKRCIAPFTSRPMPAYNVQSIDGFLARLHYGPLLLRDWDPVKLSRSASVASKLAVLALFAVAAVAITRAQHAPPLPWRAVEPLDPDSEARLFCLVLALALTTSPLTWTHYHLYLLLPLALWLSGRMVPTLPPPYGHGLWLAAALLTSLPAVIIEPEATSRLAAITSRTVVSLHLLGALLCFAAIVWSQPRGQTN